jgi:hypothetical protein
MAERDGAPLDLNPFFLWFQRCNLLPELVTKAVSFLATRILLCFQSSNQVTNSNQPYRCTEE